ncbi:MAG: hypothetical protein HXY42_03240 [Chloroflexi bacterium]|nr:hypothetical protein [Chloroflexota bacterium]
MKKRTFPPFALLRACAAWTVLSLAVLACGVGLSAPPAEAPAAPQPTQASIVSAPTSEVLVPVTGGGEPTPLPAIPERRRVTLEFPAKIRAGDSDLVRLTLEVDDLGNVTPTAQIQGNIVTGEVIELPDLYETHNVIAEARFDIAGLQVSPPETISQTLSKGQSLDFYWSVRPAEAGVYRGTIWFYLRFVDKVTGDESRRTVSAQIVEIEAVNVLGIPARLVRITGGIGSVVGTIVGFPFFEDIVKYTFRRRSRKK